jgi:hypothetical protein
MALLAVLLTSIWAILSVVGWLISAFLAHHVANAKGACGACWFLVGVLFGPLALLAAVGMPDLLTRREIVQLRYAIEDAAARSQEPKLDHRPMYAE